MRLADKTALITGGASGFGRAIAETFAREGAEVTIVDLNGDGAEAVAAKIGGRAIQGDVTKAADIAAAVDAAQGADGRLDIVVNNAGWTHKNKPIMEVTEEEYDRLYDVNVRSIFHMTRACVPVMRAQGGGNIINIGSTAGLRPRPGLTWYNSTKGAVNLLSKSMAVELAPDKIRVNCVAPVIGATGLLEDFMGKPDTPENRAGFIAGIPLGRMSEPADIANACLYLASDEAEFITGIILEVDGGRTI
ncbi:4-formylbenzenesulfonate dehydrogenase TsaC1/TsaC2 [Roseivivax sp. THAF40]|uniref:SDR family oxidoreductase n=1 Tax=unclassified Roseivivax TaxID=2639302 RepID=UPI0012683072|nr:MULTISPECIES: SDR family oxidoreductase [unclassified Roseivivax]QFS83736.1 4-formylbenzenesulfonate dehydrogenase TsaC1/TsaC2 [Roseivivax sp. THAF197b]QFT47538.1 4-formylbenzenesulfonate dehydrogenase TsaC1/TsaC2 [Roseivivax sp. THAF40]